MFDPNWRAAYATPGDLAVKLDPRTIQTPALDLIDAALVEAATTPDARLIICMPPQEGKLVDHNEVVPTPDGYRRHGDLQPGDWVYHPTGRPIRVTAISHDGQASMRVTTSEGGSVVVHPAHEWTIFDRARGQWTTVETRSLAARRLQQTNGRFTVQLPDRGPLEGRRSDDVPLDPYTLGVWLGDGSTSKGAVTHHEDDHYVLPYKVSSRQVHPTTGCVTTYYVGLWADLKAAGVAGDKHIPHAYLWGDIQTRWDVLCGLIDSDGSIAVSGQVLFANTNTLLAKQTAQLIRSLGYRVGEHVVPPRTSSSGIVGKLPVHIVTYSPRDGMVPARLARKAGKIKGTAQHRRISIVSVEPVEPRPGRCITVASTDGLYLVGEQMIPTHNSFRCSRWFPLWLLHRNPDTRIAIISYESNIARRWGRAVRDTITQHGKALGLRIRDDLAAQHEWQLDGHEGGVYTAGIGGALTGRPVDLLIIDDPIKDRADADSPTIRQNVIDWWTDTGSTRLAPGAPVVLIQTRWHPDDLAGWLLSQEDAHRWKLISIPAQAECLDPADDPLGRQLGEFMASARRRTVAQWEKIKAALPARTWAALYQQRPTPAEGTVWQESWISAFRGRTGDSMHQWARVLVGVDPAVTSKTSSDETGIVVTAMDTEGTAWVVDDRSLRGTPTEWGCAVWHAVFDWNARTLQTLRIARPTLGNEETQCHHYRHFTPRKRQRHQCLAIGRLAERRGILWSDTNRTIALLRHRRVVDDQHRILAADQAIGLNQQFRLQWRCIPDAISDEMVQLVVVARHQPRRHRLHALAITRSNQSGDI